MDLTISERRQEQMKVLIVGNGGREHVLADLASRSPAVEKFFCFGPNAGIRQEPKYCLLEPEEEPGNDVLSLIDFVRRHDISLTIVGPEAPLVAGVVDQFREAGLSIFGPTKAAAQLEGSKWFAKEAMSAARVPTAPAVRFERTQGEQAFWHILNHTLPLVVKADGLAAGKGAMVCPDRLAAANAICRCFFRREFGGAGGVLLVERFLEHHPNLLRAELSVLALVDIHGNLIMFPAAQDYKPINDGDKGDNTGGMGAFAPVSWVTEAMMQQIGERIFSPTIAEMKKRGTPFSGVLYAGLMWTADGPKVVEFNVRFGDPELQPLVMLLETDLIPILKTIADGGSIADIKLQWKTGAAVCLVLASKGYPGSYEKGRDIYGLDKLPKDDPDFKVFHAGTRLRADQFPETNGGRVLDLTQYSPAGLEVAAARVRELASDFSFGKYGEPGFGVHFRTDVGIGVPTSID